jgi:4-amino-4-deoxy-L-arabinose transferase-like glycosyltransferase
MLLLVVACTALGWNLGGYHLLDPDEGRTAEIAREMLASGDYVVPHLDGLPYLDKPVGYFGAAAAAMAVVGCTEAAARLPALLATLATTGLLVAVARRRWGPTAGWLAGVGFATMPLTLGYAHVAMVDSLLTLSTTAATLAFVSERPTLAWGALALGALTKGPVALAVPCVTIVPYRLAAGLPLRSMVTWRGVGLFAAATLPWVAAMAARFPAFPAYVFGRETLLRFATPAFHRAAPVWYYVPILAAGAFPWVVPAGAGLRTWRSAWQRRHDPSGRDAVWLTAWVLGPLILFTLDQSKLPHYVLPILPAIALAAARALSARGPGASARVAIATAGCVALTLVALYQRLGAWLPVTPAERAAVAPTVMVLATALVVSTAGLALATRSGRLDLAALAYALPALSLAFGSARLMTAVGDDRSSAQLAAAIAPAVTRDTRLLGVAAFPPSLPFYLRRQMDVATADGHELTSNYIVAFAAAFRGPTSPLMVPGAWRSALAECPVPTVFIVPAGDTDVRATFAALALLGADRHTVAYGPCRPRARG